MHRISDHGRGSAASARVSLKSVTALRGALAATLLLSSGAAQAADECGLPEDGMVVCTSEGNPYPAGISYESTEDLTLNVLDGVVSERGVYAGARGGASLIISIADGASINNWGFIRNGVTGVVETGGSLTIDAAGPIVTEGFLAAGIRALNRGGPITVHATDIDTTGGTGISVGGSEGTVFIEATGHIRATDGGGLFGTGSNSVAGMFVVTDGDVEIVNSGLVEQIGSPEFDPDGTYVTTGGITILTQGDIIVRGDGSIDTNSFGATGISARGGGGIDIRQASIVTRGDQAIAVGASAPGQVSVDVDTVVSELSLGITALSSDGDVAIRFDSLSAVALGAYGESFYGSVSVAAGDATITASPVGLNGSAIQILSGLNADVSLSGAVSVEQGFGISIDSVGDSSAALADTATIDADFDGVRMIAGGHGAIDNLGSISGGTWGIRVESASAGIDNDGSIIGWGQGLGGLFVQTTGDARIGGAGAIVAGGDDAFGLQVFGQAVEIAQASVKAEGANATAISAVGSGDVRIDVGEVSSAQYNGLFAASSTGTVDIEVDSLEATGIGIDARAPGAITIAVGSANVLGFDAQAILAASDIEANVSVTGDVRTPEGYGVSIFSQGDAQLEIASSGSIAAGLTGAFISIGPDGVATVDNAGTLSGNDGYALFVEGGSATIANSGTLNGGVLLTAGDDLLDNDGTFNAFDESDFGDGDDRLVNAGIFDAAASGAASVELIGLERFTNGGEVSLADGETNDELSLSGNYVGEEGVLALDIADGEADILDIGGTATGRTFVAPNGLTGLLDTGALIVYAADGSSPDAFTTDELNIGFVEYGIRYDAGTGYSLVGAPGDAAIRTVRYVEGARNLWHDSSDAWAAHMRGLRHAEATGPGFWVQARGSVASRRGVRSDSVSGIAPTTDVGYRQDHFGAQFGYDFSRSEEGFGFGLTAGYGSSDMGFRQSRSSVDFSVVNAGAYVAFVSGPFFANLLGKYDHVSGEARDQAIGLDADSDGSAYGATAEMGVRLGSDRLFAEPLATLSWVHADLDGFSALASELDFRATDGLLGKLGARVGSSWASAGGTHFSLYAGGNAAKTFGERDAVIFSNNGQSLQIENDRVGLYGEAMLGLSVVSQSGVTGYFEGFGTFGSSDDLRGAGGRAGIRVAF